MSANAAVVKAAAGSVGKADASADTVSSTEVGVSVSTRGLAGFSAAIPVPRWHRVAGAVPLRAFARCTVPDKPLVP